MSDEIIKGYGSLMGKINSLSGPEFIALQKQTVLKLAQETSEVARMLAPVDSGELRSSIHEAVEEEPGVVIGTSYTNAEQAAYNEFGTGPIGAATNTFPGISHSMGPWKIKRKGGKTVMADYWVYFDEAKQSFFSTRGMPARPFMYPAAQQVKAKQVQIMRESAQGFFRRHGRGG